MSIRRIWPGSASRTYAARPIDVARVPAHAPPVSSRRPAESQAGSARRRVCSRDQGSSSAGALALPHWAKTRTPGPVDPGVLVTFHVLRFRPSRRVRRRPWPVAWPPRPAGCWSGPRSTGACSSPSSVLTVILIRSLPLKVPRRISSVSGSSTCCSIARRSGRAPKSALVPFSIRNSLASSVSSSSQAVLGQPLGDLRQLDVDDLLQVVARSAGGRR